MSNASKTPEQIICDAGKSIIELQYLEFCAKNGIQNSAEMDVQGLSSRAWSVMSELCKEVERMRESLLNIDHHMCQLHELTSIEVCRGAYPQNFMKGNKNEK